MNYSSGGVVNAGVAPTINTENTSNSNVVNIPINIESNGNNASSNGLDASQLRSAVQSAVLNEIQRQQRQGGTIPKR
jgi:phage-related minor tail protein